MSKIITKEQILLSIDEAFRELESQKFALDQSAIVAITDVKGNITYVNEQFCSISGYSEEELIGQNHRIINSGHHPPSFFKNMWKTIASGKVWKADIKNRAKDGSFYWVATTITPYLNEKGKPRTYVSIRFDITRKKELELELEEKLKELNGMFNHLADQNKQLEDFCYIISHNLRGPLSNLLLLTDMLDHTESAEEKVLYIEKVKPVVGFLQETFEELVNAIQVKKDMEIKKVQVDLQSCLDKTIGSLQGDILKSGAKVSSNFSDIPSVVFPKKYVDSIFYNLLSNAIKYRSPERPPRIHIKSYVKNKWVHLEVKDNGSGIDMNRHGEKLFKMRKTFHNHPGAKGFGLFITKTQLEAMDGRIWADSAPDKGTTFFIKLHPAQGAT